MFHLLQVAQHLANTYGDQAVKVAKLAKQTGKRWPVIGQRLHEDYPYIEAEVSVAVHIGDGRTDGTEDVTVNVTVTVIIQHAMDSLSVGSAKVTPAAEGRNALTIHVIILQIHLPLLHVW